MKRLDQIKKKKHNPFSPCLMLMFRNKFAPRHQRKWWQTRGINLPTSFSFFSPACWSPIKKLDEGTSSLPSETSKGHTEEIGRDNRRLGNLRITSTISWSHFTDTNRLDAHAPRPGVRFVWESWLFEVLNPFRDQRILSKRWTGELSNEGWFNDPAKHQL